MGIDKLRQLSKSLLEASREYELSPDGKSSKPDVKDLKGYILSLTSDINSLVEEELKNVRHPSPSKKN